MADLVAMVSGRSNPFLRSGKGEEEPANGGSAASTISPPREIRGSKESFKMNERPGNVIENKEPLRRTPGQGWYVYENTGSYPVIAGILLKTKVVTYKPDPRIEKAPVGK